MNRIIAVLGIVAMLIGSGVAGAEEALAVKKQTTCPVMGGAVNTNVFFDYEGKRIYLCCKGCLAAIKKNPAQYVAKLEKEGVVLDKVGINGK